jgi:hypothetical protein
MYEHPREEDGAGVAGKRSGAAEYRFNPDSFLRAYMW